MRLFGVISGVSGALAVAGVLAVAPAAQAQSAPAARQTPPAVSLTDAQRAQEARRSLQWNQNGRWGLNLNLQQPAGRQTEWSDVQAGAYYRVNPRLSVGASAGVSFPDRDFSRPADPERGQPRVRIETIFRF